MQTEAQIQSSHIKNSCHHYNHNNHYIYVKQQQQQQR